MKPDQLIPLRNHLTSFPEGTYSLGELRRGVQRLFEEYLPEETLLTSFVSAQYSQRPFPVISFSEREDGDYSIILSYPKLLENLSIARKHFFQETFPIVDVSIDIFGRYSVELSDSRTFEALNPTSRILVKLYRQGATSPESAVEILGSKAKAELRHAMGELNNEGVIHEEDPGKYWMSQICSKEALRAVRELYEAESKYDNPLIESDKP